MQIKMLVSYLLKILGSLYLGLLVISIFLSTGIYINQDKNTESQDLSAVDYVSMALLSPFFIVHKTTIYIRYHWLDILKFIWEKIIVNIVEFIWN